MGRLRDQVIAVALATGVAQLAAFSKLWLIAKYFGVSTELDAYQLAFVVPTLVAGLISAVVQTGLFPIYAGVRARGGDAEVKALECGVFWILAVLGFSISTVVFLNSERIAGLLAGRGSAALIDATAYVLRFSAFAVCLNAVGDFLGYVLALRGRYVIAASAPIANALVGAGLLVTWPEFGLTNLAVGTLLGILVQALIAWCGAVLSGMASVVRWPGWAQIDTSITEIARLGAWILPGALCSNLASTIPPVLLVPYGEGAVSAFGYAFRLHQSAVQLGIMAVSPVLLSRFSDLVARSDWHPLRRLQRLAGLLSIAIGTAAVLVVAYFGRQILDILIGEGRFDATAVARVNVHWLYLTLAFGPAFYGTVLAKLLQAERQAHVLSVLSLLALVALVAVAYAPIASIGEYQIALAVSISIIVPTLLMHAVLSARQAARAHACHPHEK